MTQTNNNNRIELIKTATKYFNLPIHVIKQASIFHGTNDITFNDMHEKIIAKLIVTRHNQSTMIFKRTDKIVRIRKLKK